MSEPILFIGGPYDGKRKEWNSPHATQKVLTMTLGEPLEDVYRLVIMVEHPYQFVVAVHEGELHPMKRLIEKYQP